MSLLMFPSVGGYVGTNTPNNDRSGLSNDDLRKRFLTAGRKLYQLGSLAGYRIIPTANSGLLLFSALPVETQKTVIKTLEASCRVYSSLIANKTKMRNPSAIVWAAFRELGLVPPPDFFDKIGSDDVIQLYSSDGLHLFASFRFFDLCSYTIEEIYSRPWLELWSRSESALSRLIQIVQQVMAPRQTTTISLNEPSHQVLELASAFKFELSYSLRCIAPLWDKQTHVRAGYIVVERVEITSERDVALEERALNQLARLDTPHGPDFSIL